MRYCFVICLLVFLGCSKKPAGVKTPECQLTSITRHGYAVYPLTYNGTKIIKVGADPSLSSILTYNSKGRLATIQMPSENPKYKTELFYNDEDKIAIEKNYERRGGPNWVENTVLFYTYTNSKITAIRETVQWASPALEYDHEVIWDGNNISSTIVRSGSTAICTRQYSYDTTQKNPITAFIGLYYADYFGSSFKRPLYFSANMLIKEDSNCPPGQITNITYNLSDSLHIKVYIDGSELIAYNYECR